MALGGVEGSISIMAGVWIECMGVQIAHAPVHNNPVLACRDQVE